MNTTASGVAILLWASDPAWPHRLVTPFVQAAAAAAFDIPVEIYFSAGSVELLRPGCAASLRASAHASTVYDAMRQASELGAVFHACSSALAARGLALDELIPECRQHGGAIQFMARAIDLRWRTLVF